jgi:hypothetical protein
MTTVPHLALGGGDFIQSAAEMDCSGASAFIRAPRDGAIERPIQLEYPGP